MSGQLASILIPCFNAQRWVAQTLESALAQTWPNKEIIVVDDGSSDQSLAVIRKFASPRVKVISQDNRGASAARNRALKESQGDFIQYLDADDLLAPDKIELQMKRLAADPLDRVAAGAWGRFYDSPDNTQFIPDLIWADLPPIDWLVISWSNGLMMASHAWLTPRAVVEKAGGWDETRCPMDDGEYFTRIVLNSSGVSFCRAARSYYRSGIQDSWSKGTSPEITKSIYRAIELCTTHLLAREDSARTRQACANFYQGFIYSLYPEMPQLVKQAEAKVQALGGSNLKPGSTAIRQFVASIIGWKLARRIKRFPYQIKS